MRIGAQLYTVRDFCKTTEDFAEALRKVADIGYRIVQVSGTCAYEPAWLKEQLDKNGLQCVLTHIPTDRLTGDASVLASDHNVFGCEHIGLGGYVFDGEDLRGMLDVFLNTYKPVAKALKEHGKTFMYHNHATEFRKLGGITLLEHICSEIPADEMGVTLDTFWVQVGGGDPAAWLEKLSSRVQCIHLKDYAYGRKMAVIGEGNINFDRVFAKAEKSGVDYMLVEQDDCNGEDPFECLRRSYEYLRSCGLE